MSDLIERAMEYLGPPGNGVFTVHTAKELKDDYHQKIYATSQQEEILKAWKNSLQKLSGFEGIGLLGVPSDTGGGIQRGANWGPLFLRAHDMQTFESVFDIGDVKTVPHLLHDKYLNAETRTNVQKALYADGPLKSELPVSALSIAQDFASHFYSQNPKAKLLSLGGDHSVSYPLVKAWLEEKKKQSKKTAIIHFDAHTDLMSHRLGVDICFASWAYHMIELLEKPSDLLQYGIRSSGQNKQFWTDTLGVQQFWANDILSQGIGDVIEETISYLKKRSIEEVYISFDIDFLDASYASATGTPEKGGLAPHDAVLIIESVAQVCRITGADLVEVAPFVASYMKDDKSLEPFTTLQSATIVLQKLIEVMS